MKTALLALGLFASVAAGDNDGLLGFDTRWQHAHFLTYRPGNGQRCDVDPPRMSWPYVPGVIVDRDRLALREFTLQLSRSGDFARPDVQVRTPYNFHNALGAVAAGRWHWRVGWDVGTKAEQWSAVRSFTIAPDAVAWDRSAIATAAKRLARRPHPRLGPPKGDWAAWRKQLAAGGETGAWLEALLRAAEKATRRAPWKKLPASDRKDRTDLDERDFTRIARDVALCALAGRLTGQQRYAPAKDHALALARYPKGGMSSPEYNGQGRTKWPTQITEYLAVCYDWLHGELSPAERKTLLASIEWRLRATYLDRHSWRTDGQIRRQGVACFAQSHPYENFMWSLPAVLLTAGDSKLADELAPLCLNYLAGVTAAHGPDEGWNEGLCYGTWKGRSMVQASMHTALLLPELKLGRNPYYRRLARWYAHLLPLGLGRLSFGDYAARPDRALVPQRDVFRHLAWLTGDGQAETRRRALVELKGNGLSGRPWLDLLGAARFTRPAPAREATRAVFGEAGWVMLSSRRPSEARTFGQAVGMIFKCRPRGGHSHSYRSENDFVWHAGGQALSASGGGTAYPDPHSRHTMSHNGVLVNGRGQQWDPRRPRRSLCGRLLAWREGKGFVHFVGDATAAYQTAGELLRWHRHVVFVDEAWFVVFDDLAVRPDAGPASFQWLFHVHPKVPLEILRDRPGLSYRVGDVHARVLLANPAETVRVVDMPGRKGSVNLATGEDLYDATVAKLAAKGRKLPEAEWMAHNVWVTNRRPVRQWCVLAVLLARREGDAAPEVTFPSPRAVRVSLPDGAPRCVSFDPNVPGDVTVDLAKVRRHAAATDPDVLPPATGPVETVRLGQETYRAQWLARERFDRDDWPCRWAVEGNSEVAACDGKLTVRNLHAGKANVATVWYRPELPADVLVRFRAKAVAPAEKNAANLNLFLHARESADRALRFGRSGLYKEYHAIPNYIVTFVGGFRAGWSRARRDPGFRLLHEADVRSEVGKEYRIAVAVQGGRLRYYVDGKKLHDVTDKAPLPGGRFALRTWSTNAWWADVEFARLLPPAGTER